MFYYKISEDTPFVFEEICRNAKNEELKFGPHYHNYFELYYMDYGSCDYFIDNKCYHIEAGDVIFIPEGAVHSALYRNKNESSRLLINCTAAYIPDCAKKIFSKRSYLYRNNEASAEIRSILKQIGDEYYKADEFSDEAARCLLELLFFKMARNKNLHKEEDDSSGYIEEAVNYIQTNLADEITLSDIAARSSVSCEHFSRRFKNETGFGFSEYLTIMRLKKAEALLKQSSDIKISEIATACGFSDSNYFSLRFKQMYHLSPREFRREMAEKKEK